MTTLFRIIGALFMLAAPVAIGAYAVGAVADFRIVGAAMQAGIVGAFLAFTS